MSLSNGNNNELTISQAKSMLTGALIGLSCTSYNHGSDDHTMEVLVHNLAVTDAQTEITLPELLDRIRLVHNEKNRISPGCCACMAKCGNSDDFDLTKLQKEEPQVRSQKQYILTKLRERAQTVSAAMKDGSCPDKSQLGLFRKGLANISYPVDAEALQPIIDALR